MQKVIVACLLVAVLVAIVECQLDTSPLTSSWEEDIACKDASAEPEVEKPAIVTTPEAVDTTTCNCQASAATEDEVPVSVDSTKDVKKMRTVTISFPYENDKAKFEIREVAEGDTKTNYEIDTPSHKEEDKEKKDSSAESEVSEVVSTETKEIDEIVSPDNLDSRSPSRPSVSESKQKAYKKGTESGYKKRDKRATKNKKPRHQVQETRNIKSKKNKERKQNVSNKKN